MEIKRTDYLTATALFIFASFMFVSISLMSLAHIALVIPCTLGILTFNRKKYWHLLPKSAWCLLILVMVGLISLALQGPNLVNPWKKWLHLKYYALSALSLTTIPFVLKYRLKSKHYSLMIKLFFFSTSVATISGLIGLFFHYNPLRFSPPCHPTRACGLNGMYMSYGYGISFFMVVITMILVDHKKWKDWVSLRWIQITWLINFFGLIFSFARGGWVTFLSLFPILFWRTNPKRFINWSLKFFLSVLLIAAPFYQKIGKIFFSRERIQSNYIRFSNYEAAWKTFLENPFFGVGPRNFEEVIGSIKEKYHIPYSYFHGHAHNNFLELLASTGALGFVCIFLFHLFWFLELKKRNDFVARTLLPFPVALFIAGQFQYTLGDAQNLFFTMTLYTLSQCHFVLGGIKNEN